MALEKKDGALVLKKSCTGFRLVGRLIKEKRYELEESGLDGGAGAGGSSDSGTAGGSASWSSEQIGHEQSNCPKL